MKENQQRKSCDYGATSSHVRSAKQQGISSSIAPRSQSALSICNEHTFGDKHGGEMEDYNSS